MNGPQLQEHARARVQELPGAHLEHPFGPGWEVFKVVEKAFMLLTDAIGEPIVILKADPEDSKALQDEHEDITPGYDMSERHWITLHPAGEPSVSLVEELVTESHLRVVDDLPRARRPVDPATFGQGTQ